MSCSGEVGRAAALELSAGILGAVGGASVGDRRRAWAASPGGAPAGPEWLSPIEAVVPGQLWVKALAEARGLTPDAPPGLTKVTLTR